MILAMTVLCGLAYPLLVLGASQVAFKDKANGSMVQVNGVAVGSSLIGQNFTKPEYFQPRPSAAGKTGYDPLASSASNLGPTNEKLIAECLPVATVDDHGDPKVDDKGAPLYRSNLDGSPVCDPNTVAQRVIAYRQMNELAADAVVPVDAVTSSGSGLDPHISVDNARLQAIRVAKARNVSLESVNAAIDQATVGRTFGVLGEAGVNVFELNVALDAATTR